VFLLASFHFHDDASSTEDVDVTILRPLSANTSMIDLTGLDDESDYYDGTFPGQSSPHRRVPASPIIAVGDLLSSPVMDPRLLDPHNLADLHNQFDFTG
jgi:hypothetical protein